MMVEECLANVNRLGRGKVPSENDPETERPAVLHAKMSELGRQNERRYAHILGNRLVEVFVGEGILGAPTPLVR
jgi:hypothetical protein